MFLFDQALSKIFQASSMSLLRRVGLTLRNPCFAGLKAGVPAGSRNISTYYSVEVFSRSEVEYRANKLYDTVMGTNWADYVNTVLDGPFWEAELEKLEMAAEAYLADPFIGEKMRKIHEMMDVMYAVEDVRDHMNELMELNSRASGVMGIGLNAGEKIENLEEQCQKCADAYEELLQKYPNFKGKIEQVVGHGLATLRVKSKFRYEQQHRYFF